MKTTFIAAALFGAAFATSAAAISVVEEEAAAPGTVSAVVSGADDEFLGITFNSQNETPFSAFVRFITTGNFEVFFSDYQPIAPAGQVSGFTFYEVGGTVQTTQGTFCSGASLSEVQETCNLVQGAAGTRSDAIKPNGDALTGSLFGVLSPGEYVLGFYESENPQNVSALFRVQEMAAIPVPAAGVLLLGALGGLGLVRRRTA